MPGIIIHTEIARRIARQLKRDDLLDEGSATSRFFFQGAVAPDIGVFPGSDTFLSELTHYLKSGQLSQCLLRRADTPERKAFAIGWLSHCLGDALIHPLINRAAGERKFPGEGRAVSWEDDPNLHLQVELGLDGAIFFDLEMSTFEVPSQVLDREWGEFLKDIFFETYGIHLAPDRFVKSHGIAQHYNRLLMEIAIIHASRLRNRPLRPQLWRTYLGAFFPAQMLELILGRHSPYYRVSTVYTPSRAFLDAAQVSMEQAVKQTIDILSGRSAPLANLNLDTGLPAIRGSYRALDRARAKLENLQQS